jgi:putative copper resistance protein D
MLTAALAIVGWIDLAATMTLAGGVAYGAFVGPPARGGRRALGAAAAALALALGAEFILTVLRMEEVARLGARAVVVDLFAARWGQLWIARGVGLAAIGSALAARRPAWSLLAPVVWVWLLVRSVQGHAGAHGMVTGLIDWLHLQAAAAWVGGLVQLALLPRPVAASTAHRMRTLATGALALLIPGGVYLAVIHVQHLHMLVGSAYGWTLLAKLALAAPLLGLGAANHFRHVPAMDRGDTDAAPRLSRTVRIEIGIVAAILLLTAVLGVLPMPHLLTQ